PPEPGFLPLRELAYCRIELTDIVLAGRDFSLQIFGGKPVLETEPFQSFPTDTRRMYSRDFVDHSFVDAGFEPDTDTPAKLFPRKTDTQNDGSKVYWRGLFFARRFGNLYGAYEPFANLEVGPVMYFLFSL